jgi:hypothetical protein
MHAVFAEPFIQLTDVFHPKPDIQVGVKEGIGLKGFL